MKELNKTALQPNTLDSHFTKDSTLMVLQKLAATLFNIYNSNLIMLVASLNNDIYNDVKKS